MNRASIERKIAASVLSLTLLLPAPAAFAAAPSRPVQLADLALTPAAPVAPVSFPEGLSPHPVVEAIKQMKAAGILPEEETTRLSPAALQTMAQSLPQGSQARQTLSAMAQVMAAAKEGTGAAQGDRVGPIFDAAATRAQAEPAKAMPIAAAASSATLLDRLARLRLLPSSVRRALADKAENRRPKVQPLDADLFKVKTGKLRWTPPAALVPASTRGLEMREPKIVGQDQALKDIAFGLKMPGNNYNLYISGPESSGRETAVKHILEHQKIAEKMPTPPDIVSATNFAQREQPVILELPPGAASEFAEGVSSFVEQLKSAASAIAALSQNFVELAKRRREALEKQVGESRVGQIDFALVAEKTDQGERQFIRPVLHGKEMRDADLKAKVDSHDLTAEEVQEVRTALQQWQKKFKELDAQDQKEYEKMQAEIGRRMAAAVQQAARPLFETVSGVKPRKAALDAEIAAHRIGRFGLHVMSVKKEGRMVLEGMLTFGGTLLSAEKIAELVAGGKISQEELDKAQAALPAAVKLFNEKFRAIFAPSPAVREAVKYVKSMMAFATDNFNLFYPAQAEAQDAVDPAEIFKAGILVSNAGLKGAPVIFGRSIENLFGRASNKKRLMMVPGVGVVETENPGGPSLDYGGDFLRANGGFLILDMADFVRVPDLWPFFLRAVSKGEAEIVEGGLSGLLSLRGGRYRVPAKVKVVLIGSPMMHMMLAHNDAVFAREFRVLAQFESALRITEEILQGYFDFLKKMVAYGSEEILDLTREAIAGVLEFSARLVDSNERLSAQFGALLGLLRESSFLAREAGREEITGADVAQALAARRDREGSYQRRMLEIYSKNIVRVETSGAVVGQINGLAVRGDYGIPMRVTITVGAGSAGLNSSDEDAQTTGAMFNKALSDVRGFLKHTFAQKKPIPADIQISVEQISGGIDGDSATSTEIYGALSSLSGVPLQQRFAVTGSADQFGNVQAIGGANEKIEGFFDTCLAKARAQAKAMGKPEGEAQLPGDQGVIIPAANVGDLMLRPDIVQAVREGKFHVYAVSHVSQGLEILTGVAYSEILRKAELRLEELRRSARSLK